MNKQKIGHSADGWTISERVFDENRLGKCEAIMALGNGYMGIRSATEERYLNEKRNFFVSGIFNKAHHTEVTELPNLPDVLQMELVINGKRFGLTAGRIDNYRRTLNLRTGELMRQFCWTTKETGTVQFVFRRFVSSQDLHLIAQTIIIIPKDKKLEIKVRSGIDGQQTNSGAQHFVEGEKRFYDKMIMHMSQQTTESGIDVFVNAMHQTRINDRSSNPVVLILMDRRRVYGMMQTDVDVGQKYELTKYSIVGTSRDKEFSNMTTKSIKEALLEQIRQYKDISYDVLLDQSKRKIGEKLWNQVNIQIDSKVGFDFVAARFAIYHLYVMMPAHDNRMGIGAKGLSGEGYKGHSFWDTEVFMFPYFLYTQPQLARQLLEYRYLTLPGARKKAKDNGYQGAQFPWESAWMEDGEVTPVWGAADIVTGKSTKIWSGFIEQHITADIAFAIYQYYNLTKDQDFMDQYGYQMLFETAIFWVTRLEKGRDGWFHINDVIGPDEYKEHINDNAFTNYLVHLNFELAINYARHLELQNPMLYQILDKKLNLRHWRKELETKRKRLFLPKPNADLIIPQDSSYLDKQIIDLTKYKNQAQVGSIFKDYNLSAVNDIQVSKQADIMMLFYLREDLFSQQVKQANWNYYEPKTLHDSSLSLSTHAIIANDIGNKELAYELYTRCREIDLSQNMKSSDHGIHAASLGGMLQVIINGFGGIRVLDGKLRIEPSLPTEWNRLEYDFHWHGDRLNIIVTKRQFTVTNRTNKKKQLAFWCYDQEYLLTEKKAITIRISRGDRECV